MKLSKHAKFWALGALGGVGLFALGVFAQQTLEINPSEQDLFSDLKAVFFLDRNGDEIKSIVRWNASGSTLVTAPTSELTGGEAKNTLQNNASIIGSTDSSNTSAGAFLIATNGGKVQGESMQSFIGGANNTTLSGFNTIAVATKDTNINADNALALASKKTYITAKDAIAIGGEDIKLKGQASLAIGSKIDSAAQGAMVFNAKNEPLNLNNESNNTFVINAENGLIVNTNTSANPKIQLTVSGAIKLGEVNNAPAQASPYISTKKVGNVICVCGKVNNGNIAISKYSRNNKQHAEICQKVCNNETPTLPGQCGAAATNYPLGQTQWSTDDFCQGGIGYAGAKPTFPALGGQTTWTCESFPSGGVNCTATRKGCGDGIRAAGEQCDLGTNNGKPDSNCSASCENVKAPKCGANAKTYLGSDVAWAQPNGFCADDSVLSGSIPNFRSNCNKCGLRGFPYCFDVSFDANSAVCKSSSQSDIAGTKTWTCKNKNGKNLTCTTTKQPPMVAGKCNLTQLGECDAGVLSGAIKTINNGKRWECAGLYGGSNNTCSTCNNGYTYNETSTKCEANCANPIYRHTNGVTIKAADCAEAGKEYLFEGQKYYVARDKNDIKAKIRVNIYPANRIVTTRVTDMGQMFHQNFSFNEDIGNWDTSNVTNMRYMFAGARAFNQPLNNWDTSKVTDMRSMFDSAYAFNQPLNNWDTSKVTDMRSMFDGAYAFNQPLNNWDTSKVTTMRYMFAGARAFNQPLNNWDTSNVTNMDAMFFGARAFNQPLNNWDTSNVTNMSAMFFGARAFNQPLNNWDTSNVTNMSAMFYEARAFNQPLNNWDISGATIISLSSMFTNATAFKANQPYCSWENWSAKKWWFTNMGLNACPVTPICPSGFTAYNGKCVQRKCGQNAQAVSQVSGVCKDKSESFQNGPHLCINNQHGPKYQNMPKWNPITGCPSGYKDIPVGIIGSMPSVPKEVSGILTARGIVSSLCSSYSEFECTRDRSCEWDNSQATLDKIREFSEAIASEELGPRSLGKIKEGSKCTDSEGNTLSDTICENAGIGTKEDVCRSSTTCSEGFSMHNGKCVKWECRSDTPPPPAHPPHSSVGSSSSSVSEEDEDEGSSASEEAEIAGLSCLTSKVKRYAYGKYRDIDDYINKFCSIEDKKLLEKMKEDEEKEDYIGLYGYRDFKNSMRAHGDSRPILPPPSQGAPIPPPPSSKKVAKCIVEGGELTGDQICVSAIGQKPTCTTSPVNGQCKTYAGTHASQPATATANGCVAGEYEDLPDDANNWKWKCKGKNRGFEDICHSGKEYSLEIKGKEINQSCGSRRLHITIKNPKGENMKIEHSYTLSSINVLRRENSTYEKKQYSKKLEKLTSEKIYEFDLPEIPKPSLCGGFVKGEFSIHVTINGKEEVKKFSYQQDSYKVHPEQGCPACSTGYKSPNRD